jgi:signal transduction histidine kinase
LREARLGGEEDLGEPQDGGARAARRGLGRQGGLLAGRRAACGAGSMRERAALVGGEIELESDPVRGPSVRLRVPLPQGTPE